MFAASDIFTLCAILALEFSIYNLIMGSYRSNRSSK